MGNQSVKIQNVYCMLSYAYQVLKEQGYKDVALEQFDHINDLYAAILIKGVSLQVKKGLGREYISHTGTLAGIKGKMEISESIKSQSIFRNQMVCTYDEFSINTYMNQIIKTTLMKLLSADIDITRKKEIRNLLMYFVEVDTLDVHCIDWKLQYNRNHQTYRMLMSICYLVLKGLIQTTSDGTTKVMDLIDEKDMCHLYEKFILEYFRSEFPVIQAEASFIRWELDDGYDSMLPDMRSDITLSYGNRILIIDAKYYSHTTQVHYDRHTIHSANLYQIFTYVKNKEAQLKDQPHEVAGMLLYAKTDEEIQPDHQYRMSGNQISVKTLDLNCSFVEIERQLYQIARDFFGDIVDTRFYLKAKGCDGIGIRSGDQGFLVFAGSRLSLKHASTTCPLYIQQLRTQYKEQIVDGKLMENILFHSASAAASFLMMEDMDGNMAWKTEEGTCLGNYRKKY